MKLRWAENLRDSLHELAESLGNLLVESFHYGAVRHRRRDGLGGSHGVSRHGREGPYHDR